MSQNKYTLLQSQFGHQTFRPLQEEAVDAILCGHDLLMILPTGGGKSLAYQLPTLLMPGTTVVVSPLLALMHDQVQSLQAQGLRAQMLSSMQSSEESREIFSCLYRGEIQFLYLSPERLNTEAMRRVLSDIKLNYFVIDEAHCISEWGHEFRADFRELHRLRDYFPKTPIAAFTATATAQVRDDIERLLQMKNTCKLQGSVFRDNLHISVRHRIKDGYDQLLAFLRDRNNAGESGIVYALSRKSVEAIAHYLQTKGFNAAAYHAGLSTQQRHEAFRAFVHDEVPIMVATIAFGMGIDKSNIRFVVHMSLPKTVENYYQEMGRAGRDGEPADVVLLFGASDLLQQRRFIEMQENEMYKAQISQKLNMMHQYATGEHCRHQYIARYFGDDLECCRHYCDYCVEPEYEKRDITTASQMLLSAVYRSGQNFGKNYVIDLLRGSREHKILANGHDTLSVYGIGKQLSKKQWFVVCERMLELEMLSINEHQGLVLSHAAFSILKGNATVLIRADRLDVNAKVVTKATAETFTYDTELFESLRTLRHEMAQERGVPAYIVFGDRTLKEMAAKYPKNREEMLQISGMGDVKFERYGAVFLTHLLQYHAAEI